MSCGGTDEGADEATGARPNVCSMGPADADCTELLADEARRGGTPSAAPSLVPLLDRRLLSPPPPAAAVVVGAATGADELILTCLMETAAASTSTWRRRKCVTTSARLMYSLPQLGHSKVSPVCSEMGFALDFTGTAAVFVQRGTSGVTAGERAAVDPAAVPTRPSFAAAPAGTVALDVTPRLSVTFEYTSTGSSTFVPRYKASEVTR